MEMECNQVKRLTIVWFDPLTDGVFLVNGISSQFGCVNLLFGCLALIATVKVGMRKKHTKFPNIQHSFAD